MTLHSKPLAGVPCRESRVNFDDETWRLQPDRKPFGPKVLPMSAE